MIEIDKRISPVERSGRNQRSSAKLTAASPTQVATAHATPSQTRCARINRRTPANRRWTRARHRQISLETVIDSKTVDILDCELDCCCDQSLAFLNGHAMRARLRQTHSIVSKATIERAINGAS